MADRPARLPGAQHAGRKQPAAQRARTEKHGDSGKQPLKVPLSGYPQCPIDTLACQFTDVEGLMAESYLE